MTKTIQLNPQFLSSSTRNMEKSTRKLRDKKEKPDTLVQPNKMRNDLLKKIKDFQSKTENTKEKNNENDQDKDKDKDKENLQEFTDEFNKSLHFLQDLTNNKNNIFKNNKTRKNPKSYDVEIDLPKEMTNIVPIIASQPTVQPTVANKPTIVTSNPTNKPTIVTSKPTIETPTVKNPFTLKQSTYSSMKNGSKPTYRELNNSELNRKKPIIIIEDKPFTVETESSKMLEKIKSDYKKMNIKQQEEQKQPEEEQKQPEEEQQQQEEQKQQPLQCSIEPIKRPLLQRKIKRTTRTCKYRLGRLGNKVSVLINDYKTRKNIQNECYKLEQTSITDIKNFLRKKNLLKVGSVADEAILREMYEQTILSGDIENNNKDTLIHNFLTKV